MGGGGGGGGRYDTDAAAAVPPLLSTVLILKRHRVEMIETGREMHVRDTGASHYKGCSSAKVTASNLIYGINGS